ncbi:energy transducer TonB [Methylomicrobium sp. Wu6]|uniref:energy transducer TonB n=1 Tax=Methylomicrobium sp. Wu6 TaxID=3107928 RepID=UPI002DD647CC|nr:energy transducer TonB [Methylomicrobium sp. Wu6]MEC4747196.1 energy transducer TonB [Methylomicrobium sp. Wu6]
MPANVHKIDFSLPKNRSGGSTRFHLGQSMVIPFVPETALLSAQHQIAALPGCQRHEAVTAVLLALLLHLAAFFLLHDITPKETVTAPTPIQVSWIAAPQPKSETTPTAPPKQRQPEVRPKPKPIPVKRAKTKPKAVLSTSTSATTTTAMPAEETAKTAMPAATEPAETPAAAKPAANPAQTAAATDAGNQQPLTLPNLNADYLDNPAPRYPRDARERGERGKVLVRALINTDGTVAELSMRKSSGYASLDESALEAVKKWRFVPARRGAVAVAAWVVVPITFSLEG